jgi:hypothetical protein
LNRFDTSSSSPLEFDASSAAVASSFAVFWMIVLLCNEEMCRGWEKHDDNGTKDEAKAKAPQKRALLRYRIFISSKSCLRFTLDRDAGTATTKDSVR